MKKKILMIKNLQINKKTKKEKSKGKKKEKNFQK